ncbi:MAG: methionyl-tRNA formyltransferase [Acidimicrobiaceae bacterium]|nr:methionyl-tRNA formyltransferase [Acidimicrobiaceae bacterium]
MNVAFLGTPEAAVPSLEALVAAGHEVVLVISQPDRRRGRGSEISASPVKAAALALGLRVEDTMTSLNDVDVELAIVAAYGAMIPTSLLERTPMLNVHFSLLPRWRGAAPVERAILAGDTETGVGIISLEPTLDTGPLHAQRRTEIGEKTASQLTAELAHMGAELLVEVLANSELLNNPRPQVGESTYAAKLTPETFHLRADFTVSHALRVVALERAFIKVGARRVKVLGAIPSDAGVANGFLRCVDGTLVMGVRGGALQLTYVQPEGSRTMGGVAWWSGARLEGEVAWA